MNLQVIRKLPLTVTYGDGFVVAQIRAGRYSYVNSNITARNYPTEMTGVAQLEAQIVAFDEWVESAEALAAFENEGLRVSVALNEILCFGEQHPNEKMKGPVVDLGSVWRRPHGYRYVPELWGSGSGRRLYISWFGYGWLRSCHFLVFCK